MYINYKPETKAQAVELHNAGKSVTAISKELNISESTLRNWFLQYSTPQSVTEDQISHEVSRLTTECMHLTNTIEIIRQSGFVNEVSLQRRLEFALNLYNQNVGYTARELYEALNIAKGTFYYRLNHNAEVPEKERAKYALMLKIHEIFEDSSQVFGAEKVRAMLAREGIRVSNKRISALMREMGLESVRVDAKKQYQRREKYTRQNLLHRSFKVAKPNQVWVSDITSFKIKGKWFYLCVIIDLFSRKVIGFRVSQKSSTQLLTATFKKAYQDRGNPSKLTFHSDQGSQYTSKAFAALLKKCSVTQSLSTPGQPLDNAVAESFFSAFKKEEAYRKDYTSERHFIESVTKYIDFYNNIRPHQTDHYKTPAELEAKYLDDMHGPV